MVPASTDAALAALRDGDPDSMTRDEITELLGSSKRVRAWLDSVEVRAARQLRRLAEQGRAEPAEHALTSSAGHTEREARNVSARDELCDDRPELEDALAIGDLTAKHLDAINQAAKGLPSEVHAEYLTHSDDLMRRAQEVSLEQFGRECRQLAKHLLATSRRGMDGAAELEGQRRASKVTRWVDKTTGMHHTRLELDPIRDAKLSAVMNRTLARLRAEQGNAEVTWQQLQVDAFVATVTGDNADDGHDGHDGAGASHGGSCVDRVPAELR